MANALLTKVWEKDHGFRDSGLAVFLLVADNSNREGITWPAVETIAKLCRISPRMVQRQLRLLEEAGFIRTRKRLGTSSVYEINEQKLDLCRDIRTKRGVTSMSPPGVTPSSPGGDTHVTPGVTSMSPDPILNPQRTNQTAEKAEAIYAAYPKKVGRAAALRAIGKTLAIVDAGRLLELTLAYAAAVGKWPEEDKRFIPYPKTWFNRGSYDDDPKNWHRTYDAPTKKPSTRALGDNSNLDALAEYEKRLAAEA